MHARQVDVELRQTRIGNLLRRTSLDELPQLWNILRGDMSLVGPRPEERTYAAQFADSVYGYRDRHRLAVGLTGWAQIHGLRGDTSIEERARFDNSYIEHWSLGRDLVILIRTVAAVLRQALAGAVRTANR
jgi:lipopolysaccharide/colanic/teichoic acid biosynthesis glycosyltransferase